MNDAALTNLLAACRSYAGGRVDARFNAAAQAFYADAKVQPKIVTRAARELRSLPPPGAAILANMLGTVVETGGSVERSGPAVWELFTTWLPQIHRGFAGRKELSPRQQQLHSRCRGRRAYHQPRWQADRRRPGGHGDRVARALSQERAPVQGV